MKTEIGLVFSLRQSKLTAVNDLILAWQIQVAIKCLSKERMQNNPMEFLKEAAIMHTIDHEHIVRLYGVVLDTNSLMLVCFINFQ